MVSLLAALSVTPSWAEDGARLVKFLNYPDCVELSNRETVVVLGPHVGGRVLKYAWKGKDALYLDPREATWGTPEAGERPVASAGRFDIGPEYIIPKHDILWSGKWTAEVTGPRAAKMTSAEDPATGVQLVREFVLDAGTSHLKCTQIIRNISGGTVRWCHWSRTFAVGGGIVVVPVAEEPRRLPHGWVMYHDRSMLDFRPEDPAVRRRGRFLEIVDRPKFSKLGIEARAGWMAYLLPDDLMFVKRFPVFPERSYSDIAAFNVSVWYPDQARMPGVELEPIGPENEIAAGGAASFTEDWLLLPQKFPADGGELDLEAIERRAAP
ncbi:MAG: hypothetical protein HKO57_04675 [Akkermansiaceae bacterium]|nr:hypothetical protein [Akkermansiaceae bacterium]